MLSSPFFLYPVSEHLLSFWVIISMLKTVLDSIPTQRLLTAVKGNKVTLFHSSLNWLSDIIDFIDTFWFSPLSTPHLNPPTPILTKDFIFCFWRRCRGGECENTKGEVRGSKHILSPWFLPLLLFSIPFLYNIPWKQTLYSKQLSKEVTFTFRCRVAYWKWLTWLWWKRKTIWKHLANCKALPNIFFPVGFSSETLYLMGTHLLKALKVLM